MTNHNPWPGLPLGSQGRVNDKDGPSTNNPDFPDRKAQPFDEPPTSRPAEGFAPLSPPPPPPVVVAAATPPPDDSAPPDLSGVTLFIEPVAKDGYTTQKFSVRVEAHEHGHAYTDDEKAVRDALRGFEKWHRHRVWLAVEAAVAAYFAAGPGKPYRDAQAQLAKARGEKQQLDRDLSTVSDAWAKAVGAGDDQEVARLEAEQDALTKQEHRVRARIGILERTLVETEAATAAGLRRAMEETRAAFLKEARPREEEARAKLVAAVRAAFVEWLPFHAEAHSAEVAGTTAVELYSRRGHWERLQRLN